MTGQIIRLCKDLGKKRLNTVLTLNKHLINHHEFSRNGYLYMYTTLPRLLVDSVDNYMPDIFDKRIEYSRWLIRAGEYDY